MNAKTLTGLTLEEVGMRLDKQLPAEAYKPVPGGADLTDIDPNYMRKVLNETFGVCGYGWGYDYDASTIRSRTDVRTNSRGKEYTVIIVTLSFLNFWYKLEDGNVVYTCTVPATGSSENSNDAYALKGALTNAIGNAVSNIGFQQSVYLGKRDHRSVKKAPNPEYPTSKPSTRAEPPKAPVSKPSEGQPAPKTPAPASNNGDPGSYVCPFGANTKGKKLSELRREDVEWAAHRMNARSEQAQKMQAKARAYLETLEAVAA